MNKILILLSFFLISTTSQAKEAISVMDFKSLGVEDYIAQQVTDAFSTALVNSKIYSVMERSQVSQILKEQSFQQTGACNNEACFVEVGQLLGVDKMIFGSIGKLDKAYNLNIKLLNVETAQIIAQQNIIYEGSLSKFVQTQVEPVLQALFSVKPEKIIVKDSVINIQIGKKIKLHYSFLPENSMDNIFVDFHKTNGFKFLPPDTVYAISKDSYTSTVSLNSNRAINSSTIVFNSFEKNEGKSFWRAANVFKLLLGVGAVSTLATGVVFNSELADIKTSYQQAKYQPEVFIHKEDFKNKEDDRNLMYTISGATAAATLVVIIVF